MYYDDFDSYLATTRDAKSFIVQVVQNDGGIKQSSAMPIDVLGDVQLAIAESEAGNSAFSLWDRAGRAVVFIPYHTIRSIIIVFAGQ